MQWLRNISVSRKFLIAFGVVCGLCIVLGAYTSLMLRNIEGKNAEVSKDGFPAVILLSGIRADLNTVRREDLHLLLCTTPKCLADETVLRQKAVDAFHAAAQSYEPHIKHPGERELYQSFTASFAQYMEASDRVLALLNAGKVGDALDLLLSDSARVSLNAALAASW